MKTQEEIVIQAKAYAESIGDKDGTSAYDYVMGYNQCQEDMADVMENFLEYVRDNYTGFGAPHLVHNKGGQRKTKAIVEDFIESLNKQD